MSPIHRTRFAFGAALAAGAIVAAHSASAYTYKVIHDFCSKRVCADGNQPASGVVMDGAGNLYGTTLYGGMAFDAYGVVYQLTPNADHTHWKSRTLYKFDYNGFSGVDPWAAPILDTSGNLYGTTLGGGGQNGRGTVYELLPNGTKPVRTLKVLAIFQGPGTPYGGLTYQGAATGVPFDGTSPLYGTTAITGSFDGGSVYQLTSSGGAWALNTLYSFCLDTCPAGTKPMAGVTLDANGNVFGTAVKGGQFKQGVAYELADSGGTWTYSDVHDFCASKKCHDGAVPTNALVSDTLGNFYGTASAGGEHQNAGVIFKLAPDGTYTPVYNFCTLHNCADGALPQTDLLMASGGTLYGVTTNGGGNNIDYNFAGGGTVFAFNGSTLETLYSFCALKDCRDGEYPVGGLIMDAQGNLFGTASGGGKHGRGVVFELSP